MIIRKYIDDFLARDFSDYTKIISSIMHVAKIALANIRDIADGQLSLRAMSLVYTTLITLVPLLAISFSVLKGFNVHNQIEPWLLNFLEPLGEKAHEITDKIILFVDNIDVGVLGAVGLAFLVYSVIGLMQKIENAFNFIWRVSQSRSLARRFSDYLSVLVFGPFLIFLSAGLTTAARSTGVFEYFSFLADNSFAAGIVTFFTILIPILIMAFGFTLFYIYMPNTRVKLRAALVGGLCTALAWKVMGWAFSKIIGASAAYVVIYAAFATLIIFMIWVYLSWLVVLMGANIAFYVQNPKFIQFARANMVLSNTMRMALGLSIVEELVNAQYDEGKGVNVEQLSRNYKMPMMAVQNMLDALEEKQIIIPSEGQSNSRAIIYYPARPLDELMLGDVIKAISSYAERSGFNADIMKRAPQTIKILEDIDKAQQSIWESKASEIFKTKK
jgi:membrane protein